MPEPSRDHGEPTRRGRWHPVTKCLNTCARRTTECCRAVAETEVRATSSTTPLSHEALRSGWQRLCIPLCPPGDLMSFELHQRKHIEEELTKIVRQQLRNAAHALTTSSG